MGVVIPLFKDRRQAPPVQTRKQVAEHLASGHGHVAGPRMLLNDLHDTHDALHEMVSNHQHGA
jgi:CTP:molybdopterin cytidylyltransferase MocA